MKMLIWLMLVLISHKLTAQKVFTEDDFIGVVKKFHPVAKQASLEVRIARAELLESRGVFDPVLALDNGRKEFDGITYYDQRWVEIKIPTWYGIDFHAGKETMEGSRINNEETKGSINYVGVSVPVVKNMVIDRRRAAVQQARIWSEQSDVRRRAIINDLMVDALATYWQWWEQHYKLALIQSSLENAIRRYKMVQTAYRLGDRPAIDTLEAFTQVQVFQQRETEFLMEAFTSRLELSTFLWTADDAAYELPPDVLPQGFVREELLLDSMLLASNIHPELIEYDYKLRGLEVERRLKFQSLLPQVNLKYNQTGRDLSKTINGAWFQNNYRFGISMYVPLRLSEGRGGLQAARLKIEQTRLVQANKQVQVQTKVRQYYTEWRQTGVQLNLQANLVENYAALQRGEEIRFQNGESSLFLINARELRTIESQQKLIELQAKNRFSSIKLKGAAGVFSNL
jgi:outer membrane protein TolC